MFFLVITLTLFSLEGLMAQDCQDLSHLKTLGGMGVEVEYRQVGCEKFIKTFVDRENGEIILVEEILFSRDWKVSQIEQGGKSYQKKYRIYWSLKRDQLIEDFQVEGKSTIGARLLRFQRSKSAVFSINEQSIIKNYFETYRNEYKNGNIEADAKKWSEEYSRIDR
jgi:hypothetical protein